MKNFKLIIAFSFVAVASLVVVSRVSANNPTTLVIREPHVCVVYIPHNGYAYANESALYTISFNNFSAYAESYGGGVSNIKVSNVRYYYYGNLENFNAGIASLIFGPAFITPPLDTTGSYVSPVSDAVVDYSGIQNGQTTLYEATIPCDDIGAVYQNYQAYTAYDSSGNQISSDEDFAGNVTNPRGISLNATSGQQTSFNLTLKPSFSSSNTYYDGSAMTLSPDQSPIIAAVYQTTKEFALFLDQGINNMQVSQQWISPAINSFNPSTNGMSLPIQIDASNLQVGTYSGTITINPPSGGYFAPTYVPITLTVTPPPPPSNYTVSCAVNPNSTYSGGSAIFSATTTGSIINTPLTYSWLNSNCSGNSCVANNITSDINNYSVKVSDPYGYSASTTCPTVTVIKNQEPPAPVVSISGGPVFYVSRSEQPSVTININNAAPNQLITFIPKQVQKNGQMRMGWTGSSGQHTNNEIVGFITEAVNVMENGISNVNIGSLITKPDGTYSSPTNITINCNDIGVYRLGVNVAGATSSDAVFAVAPDPNAKGSDACPTY